MAKRKNYKKETINIVDVLSESVQKFKLTRPDIKWQIDIAKEFFQT